MGRYPAIEPVRHDGKDYAPGEAIELDESQAKALQASGAIGKALDHFDKAKAKKAGASQEAGQ